MRFSIIHFSDLHRDLANELDNPTLIESLHRDLERFGEQTPALQRPALCIVTGDLVYGVGPDSEDVVDEIRRQYRQAEELLVSLAELYFEGNRERVVILPGNHDVFAEDVRASMQRIAVPEDPQERRDLVEELSKSGSRLRWSWDELCFYRIMDEGRYSSRFQYFAEAYSNFYRGRRTFSSEPTEQFELFVFPELQFSLVALNSCHNNDPLRRAPSFHPTCITGASRQLRGPDHTGNLVSAAWHHSLLGCPYQEDHLDFDMLPVLIDIGVSLGFHGHRHRAHYIEERYHVGDTTRKITVVSTGSLCAGPRGLPFGNPRCYNAVEVDTDTWEGRVHQRQMDNADFRLPIWRPGKFSATGRSYLDFEICPPGTSRPAGHDLTVTLERAEKYLGSRRWSEALDALKPVTGSALARPLIVKAVSELGEPRQTIQLLWPPQTPVECVLVGDAIIRAGTREEVETFLTLEFVRKVNDGSVREVVRKMIERRQT